MKKFYTIGFSIASMVMSAISVAAVPEDKSLAIYCALMAILFIQWKDRL